MSRVALALSAVLLLAAALPGSAPAAAGTATTPGAGGIAAPGSTSGSTPIVVKTGQGTTTTTTGSPLGSEPLLKAGLRPARAGATGSSSLSGAAILAAVLGGLLVLAVLVWGAFRFTAYEPHWLLSMRHSFAEAGFRTSATWSEFTDWVRLGR